MADAANIGEIQILINGDWTDLQSALSEASAAAAAGAQDISDSFNQNLVSLNEMGIATTDATGEVEHLGEASHEAGEGGLKEMAEQLTLLGEALAITEGLKEFADEALSTYANTEKVAISLTALTGSADQASASIEKMKELATADALSFPQLLAADQKMTALGFSSEQTEKSLQAIADAAGAVGKPFDAVANTFDRIVLSGAASGKTLANLGLSAADLGNAMGVTADQATKAFKALDQSERIEILTAAIEKFGGVAQAQAQGLAGQWQNFKTQFELMADDVGKALAPLAEEFLDFSKTELIPFLKGLIDQFTALPKPIQDTALAVGALAVAVPPLTVAVSGVMLGFNALMGVLPAITGMVKALGLAIGGAEAGATVGLVGSLGVLLPLLVSVGGAFIATQEQIGNLEAKSKDFEAQLIRQAIAQGKTVEELTSLKDAQGNAIISTDAIKTAFSGFNDQFDKTGLGLALVNGQIVNTGAAAAKTATTVTGLGTAVEGAAKHFSDLGAVTNFTLDAIARMEQQQVNANAAFKEAAIAYDYAMQKGQGLGAAYDKLVSSGKALGLSQEEIDKLLLQTEANANTAGAAFGTFGTQMLQSALTMQQQLVPAVTALDTAVSPVITDFQKLADRINAVPPLFDPVTRKMIELSDAAANNRKQYETTRDALLNLIQMGGLTGDALDAAMKKLIDSAKTAGVDVSELTMTIVLMGQAGKLTGDQVTAALQAIADATKTNTTATDNLKQHGVDMAKQIGDTIGRDLSKSLSDVIFQTGKLSDDFKKLGEDVVKVILDDIIKRGINALEKELGNLGGMFSSVFGTSGGGGAASAASGAASAGGGIASGVGGAVSGVMGMVGAIGSAVGAVSGIISNFQMAHQTDILRSIELNTRLTATFIGGLGGGGVQDWLHIIAVNTTPLLDINTWIHDAWVQLLENTSSLKKGSGQPITINVTITGSSNAQQTAQQLATALKSISSVFSP